MLTVVKVLDTVVPCCPVHRPIISTLYVVDAVRPVSDTDVAVVVSEVHVHAVDFLYLTVYDVLLAPPVQFMLQLVCVIVLMTFVTLPQMEPAVVVNHPTADVAPAVTHVAVTLNS